jgi:hypothetical protein
MNDHGGEFFDTIMKYLNPSPGVILPWPRQNFAQQSHVVSDPLPSRRRGGPVPRNRLRLRMDQGSEMSQ